MVFRLRPFIWYVFGVCLVVLAVFLYRQETMAPSFIEQPSAKNNYADIFPIVDALDVKAEEADYFDNAKGYYAEPTKTGSYPGIVMVHEWWGLNDQIKDMAKRLAAEGYRVLAVDLYQGQVAQTSDRAQQLVGTIKQDVATKNLQAAVFYLQNRVGYLKDSQKLKQAQKVAALGWCFGGGQALQLSLSGTKLDATVMYYGQVVTDTAMLKQLKWPLLGFYGEKDMSIPIDKSHSFDAALTEADVKHQVYFYPNVGHAFANPSGANFAPAESKDAWLKTLAFLKETLK